MRNPVSASFFPKPQFQRFFKPLQRVAAEHILLFARAFKVSFEIRTTEIPGAPLRLDRAKVVTSQNPGRCRSPRRWAVIGVRRPR